MMIVTDSKLLQARNIGVAGIVFNGVLKPIEKAFKGVPNLIDYLNRDFARQNDLQGVFGIATNSRRIYYSNPEGYKKIEFMGVLQQKIIVFRMGTAADKPYAIPFDIVAKMNSEAIESDLLQGLDVQMIYVDGVPVMPGDWRRVGNTLTVPGSYANKYIVVVGQQTGPYSAPVNINSDWYLPN